MSLVIGMGTVGVPIAQAVSANGVQSEAPNISGTWVAKLSGTMGELEIVYKLRVNDGKITGIQSLPFGDSPIVDGKITGETFHFTVELESFGDIQKQEVTGKIEGDTLVLTPAMPRPPAGMGPGGPAPERRQRGSRKQIWQEVHLMDLLPFKPDLLQRGAEHQRRRIGLLLLTTQNCRASHFRPASYTG